MVNVKWSYCDEKLSFQLLGQSSTVYYFPTFSIFLDASCDIRRCLYDLLCDLSTLLCHSYLREKMKKCKTCKHWDYQGFRMGKCSGILASALLISIPNQPKGKPDGKMIMREGITTNSDFVITTENWNCKNWSMK